MCTSALVMRGVRPLALFDPQLIKTLPLGAAPPVILFGEQLTDIPSAISGLCLLHQKCGPCHRGEVERGEFAGG